jgi:uncharacterized protein (DUF2164 family)
MIYLGIEAKNEKNISDGNQQYIVNMKEKFKLPPEKRKELLGEIKAFFEKEREEKIGEVAAGKVLNFFMEKLATQFYNQAIQDAYQMISENLQDLFSLQK